MKKGRRGDNSAAIASEFGVSLKALRHYERLGLISPPRNAAGWRVYGQPELERLHAIVSLKQLGLPLARIAEILNSGEVDLSGLLKIQEATLVNARNEAEHALKLVKIARQRLAGNESIDGADLAAMVRKISGSVLRWTPEMDSLASRVFPSEQLSKIRKVDRSSEDLADRSKFWERFVGELRALPEDCEATSAEALALGRRFVAYTMKLAEGDKAFWNNNGRFWREALNTPGLDSQMRKNLPRADLFGEILFELHRRGEINFE